MTKPLLSICIPTYNREIFLKKLLDSIVSQEVFLQTNDVEIVINDWPSRDNTEELVKAYQERYKGKIRYFRNKVAIGMCPALLEAISLSGWEYTWLFGSDDLMTRDWLSVTLEMIRKEKPGIIVSDRHVFFDEITDWDIPISTWKNDIILNWPDEFIRYLGEDDRKNWDMNMHFFTFMSIFCFRQDLYMANRGPFLQKYKMTQSVLEKNYFNFFIVLFSWLHHQKIAIIKNKILVLVQWWNHGWTFNSLDIVRDLYFSVKVFRESYSVTRKCNAFFNKMLLYWFMPSVGGIIKNNAILKYIYSPLSKIVLFIFYK